MTTLLFNNCKTILKNGYDEFSDFSWLNELCKEFIQLFQSIQEFVPNESKKLITENIFLCIAQICCCLKYLERVFRMENERLMTMLLSRQYFIDRIFWCITEMEKCLNLKSTTSITNLDDNFVTSMDMAIDFLTPFTLFNKENEKRELSKENFKDFNNFGKILENLLTHAISFANVALDADKNPLRTLCENILSEYKIFEKEFLNNSFIELSLQLRASSLESVLCNLEKLLNDCLLRLVFTVFVNLDRNPIESLHNDFTVEQREQAIEKFDQLTDRLMQIGIFAAAFAPNSQMKIQIASCLASLESLDSFLIPSLQYPNNGHATILEIHWKDEVSALRNTIQTIIDTNAFVNQLIDTLQNDIDKLKRVFNKQIIENVLWKCEIFRQHLKTNETDLKLIDTPNIKRHYDDFNLMIVECKAAYDMCPSTEVHRILKRLKILLSVLRKLENSLENENETNLFSYGDVSMPVTMQQRFQEKQLKRNHQENQKTTSMNDDMGGKSECNSFLVRLENISISSSPRSIFYQSTRRSNKIAATGNFSKNLKYLQKNTPRRSSLRTAMFKKSTEVQINYLNDVSLRDENSLSLHITDILEQLTDLSSTLTN